MLLYSQSALLLAGFACLLQLACSAPTVGVSNYESSKLSYISDEDINIYNEIRGQIDSLSFKSIDDALSYLKKIHSLLQKHPKNTALATGDQRELHNFLSTEAVTKLARLDTDPFLDLNSEEKIQYANSLFVHDELTKKLFEKPVQNLVDKRRNANKPDSSHDSDKNFFTSLWCKLSNCTQQ